MEYFLMTKRQKKQLLKMFNCLGINIEDLMSIKKIEELKTENKNLSTRLELCEKALINANECIVALSQQTSEISSTVANMQNEEMFKDYK